MHLSTPVSPQENALPMRALCLGVWYLPRTLDIVQDIVDIQQFPEETKLTIVVAVENTLYSLSLSNRECTLVLRHLKMLPYFSKR